MQNIHYISHKRLTISIISELLEEKKTLALSEEAEQAINKSRDYLDQKINNSKDAFYGINTGFGSLCNVKISKEDLNQLQKNLVMSHACGVGDKVSLPIVKLMVFLKIQSLSYGHSGVALETVQRMIDFYNNGILPVVYEQGSLGASGDLAPLAHVALPLIGEGEVYYKGEIRQTAEVLKELGWKSIQLRSKEGLALLNGTQFMSSHAVYALIRASKLSHLADIISAISIDAFDCNLSPYLPQTHEIRPHQGQITTAKRILDILKNSPMMKQEKINVQDPYSFRCIPQVHGAAKDTLTFVTQTVETEINSVTDNPNIFPDDDRIISAGNFHGEPLAMGMDYAAIALSELGNISERRIYKLVSGKRGLPEFLIEDAGLNNGFMIAQYAAASIVSQNKQLCTPASVDSITSSNGQEDHVSMGGNAATKLIRIVDNLERILAIELFNASQALHYREPVQSSKFVMNLVDKFRKEIPLVMKDKIMFYEINKAVDFLKNMKMTDLKID